MGVGLAWPSLLAFVRLTTNPRVFSRPMSMPDAWAQVREWRARSVVFTPEPTPRHGDILDGWMDDTVPRSNLSRMPTWQPWPWSTASPFARRMVTLLVSMGSVG